MQRDDVENRVEPLLYVVQVLVAPTVPGRAAHVRRGDGVPVRDEPLLQRKPLRLQLRLRAAVDPDYDRSTGVLVEEDGNRLAVERLEAVQLRLDQALQVVVRARQPPCLPRLDLVRPDVPRLDGRREAVDEGAPVRGEGRARQVEILGDAPAGERHVRLELERPAVAELEPRVAVLVRADEQPPAGGIGVAREVPARLEHDALPVADDGRGVAARVRRVVEVAARPRGRPEERLVVVA